MTIFINAFLALAGLISREGGRWRRGTIAGDAGPSWLRGGWDGGGFGRGLVGPVERVFGGGVGVGLAGWEGGGAWRYVHTTGIWTDPMLTVRSKECARGQKSWRKTDPTWRKRDPTWRKSEFCWRKKNTSCPGPTITDDSIRAGSESEAVSLRI